MFVGAFIIFNTFSITVAQRMREFAMLRTIGASRRQVLRTVLLEALVIGGHLLHPRPRRRHRRRQALQPLFKALGAGLPLAGIAIRTRTIVIPLVVGIGGHAPGRPRAGAPGDQGAADRGTARGRRAAPVAVAPVVTPYLAGLLAGRRYR